MVPDPPLRAKDARPALNLRPRKINNKPEKVSLTHQSTRFLQFHFEQPRYNTATSSVHGKRDHHIVENGKNFFYITSTGNHSD